MRRLLRMLAPCLAVLLLAVSARGEGEDEGDAELTLGHHGKLVCGWQPAVFTLRNPGTAPLKVRLLVQTGQEEDHPTQRVEREVELPGGAKQRQVVWFQCAWGTLTASARAEGRELLPKKEPARRADLQPNARALSVLALSGAPAPWLQEIAAVTVPGQYGRNEPMVPMEADPLTLPSRPEGFGRIGTLICSGLPADKVTAPQLEALAAWVAEGGHLVVTATPQGIPPALAERIPPLRGYTPSVSSSFADLEKLGGSSLELQGTAPCLAGKPSGVSFKTSAPFLQRFAWGFGQVTVLMVDPGVRPFRGWVGMRKIWETALPSSRGASPEPWAGNDQDDAWNWRQASVSAHSQRPELCRLLREGLIRGLSGGWIAGIVLAYVLCVGPVQFILLRRFWSTTWAVVTIPGLAVLFTLGVLALGFATRGAGVRGNLATLHVPLPSGLGEMRWTYASVVSSFPGDYQVQGRHGAVPEQVFPDQPAEDEVFHTVTGEAVPVVSMPMRMWSARYLTAASRGPRTGGLSWDGRQLRNAGTLPVDRLLLLEARNVTPLGILGAGQVLALDAKALPKSKPLEEAIRPVAEGDGFEVAFLRSLAEQWANKGGRWVMAVSHTAEDTLVETQGGVERPLSITLLPLTAEGTKP